MTTLNKLSKAKEVYEGAEELAQVKDTITKLMKEIDYSIGVVSQNRERF